MCGRVDWWPTFGVSRPGGLVRVARQTPVGARAPRTIQAFDSLSTACGSRPQPDLQMQIVDSTMTSPIALGRYQLSRKVPG